MQQDWNPVIFNKVKDANDANLSKNRNRNGNGRTLNIGDKLRKLDNTEIEVVNKVKLTTSRAISKRRTDLKLSQKQLAGQINEKLEVISQYETGKAIPKQNILNKLERILGVYLTGNNIGDIKIKKIKSKNK